MSISNRKINLISTYIFENFSNGKIRLIEYLSQIVDLLALNNIVNLSTEEIDELCCVESNSFIQTAKRLMYMSNEKKYNSTINITYSIDYYIENTTFGLKRLIAERELYLSILNKISSLPRKEKGDIFEKVCSLFLEDIGVESRVTSSTGDEGIDILGVVNTNVSNPFFKYVFDGKVYLLAQVKYYDEYKKVDTPVIRHLIGDSSFYKYNVYNNEIRIGNKPLYLVIFSYNGFTKPAEAFAKSNNVVALNGHELIDIICNFESSSDFKSINYLLEVNKRLNK